MSDPTYQCPDCEGSNVFGTSEQMVKLNTGDMYCENVKPYDSEAKAGCLDCNWHGRVHQLWEIEP